MQYRNRLPVLVLLLALLALLAVASLATAKPLADSVILFIGDGMGPGQVEMAAGALGEPLAMQRLPYSGVVTTTPLNGEITDSAAASTAMATGYKAENGVLSLSPGGQPYETILERCLARHKTAGLITTDALWGATPAGFAVHVPDRDQGAQIAEQTANSNCKVMLGFWKDEFLPTSAGGKREDGKDLLSSMRKAGYEIAYTRDELKQAKGQALVGLFDDGPQAPRVADMVNAALARLGANADGFFLVAEGARIDWKSHDSDPSGAVLDVWELDQAVQAAADFARKRGRTLVLVTADHETGGLQITEPKRLPTLKEAKGPVSEIADHLDKDRGNVAQVMSQYAGIKDLSPAEVEQIKNAKEAGDAIKAVISERAGVKWTSDGHHTSTPVRIFAFGPGAERFAGEMDNTDIPRRIADVLGIGPFPKP